MARLVIQTPRREQLLFELLKRRTTAGRSDGNDLVLNDPNSSRFHAVIELTSRGYVISDQNSRNGLFVGGRRCREALLENGTTIRLGDTVLRFEDISEEWNQTTLVEQREPAAASMLAGPSEKGLIEATDAFRRLSIALPLPKTAAEMEKELLDAKRRALLFELVSRTRRLFQQAHNPQDVLGTIPRLVFSATQAERVLVMLWDEDKQCLLPASIQSAPGQSLQDTQVALSQTLLNTVLNTRRAVLVRDARADPQLMMRESVAASGLRSAVCVPLTVHDHLYGLIYADNRHRAMVFDEDDVEVLSILGLEAALALDSVRVHEELLQQERIRLAYRRFLPEHLAERVLTEPEAVRLGGVRQELTALFADLRGFTAVAERLAPEEAVELLNSFFTEMTAVIFRHSGTLDKYLGDGLLAVFGAPLTNPDDALRAVKCAIDMQAALEELAAEWRSQDRPAIPMGIGLNTGEAIAGNVGSPQHMEYTVIGDTVNVAARLTATAGAGEVLMGKTTWDRIRDQFSAEPLPPLMLKGKREPTLVYRLRRSSGTGASSAQAGAH